MEQRDPEVPASLEHLALWFVGCCWCCGSVGLVWGRSWSPQSREEELRPVLGAVWLQ